MRIRILSVALLVVARFLQTHAACIGCPNTIALSPDSQSISYTSSGSKESFYINSGADIVVFCGVNVDSAGSRFAGNTDGNLQNLLSPSHNQYITNNYWLVSRPVMPGKGNINNMSGGISRSSSFAFNRGNFIYNNGLEVFLADVPDFNGNLSGAGNATVGENLTTNSGPVIHAERSWQMLEPLSNRRMQILSFGPTLLSQILFLRTLPVKAGFLHIKDQIPGFPSGGLCSLSHFFGPDFGINFQIMEKYKNLFSPNQLIYNI
jgi:hypothetical protein